MLKSIDNALYLKELIEINRENTDSGNIDNTCFMKIIRGLTHNMELLDELELLKPYEKTIKGFIKNDTDLYNLILNHDNICEFTNDSDLIEIFNFLGTQSICVIVEPNGNIYSSLDYSKIVLSIGKYISVEATRALMLHKSVQETVIVDCNNKVLNDNVKALRDAIIVDCDFEKNPILFSYCCEVLSAIELSVKAYCLVYR